MICSATCLAETSGFGGAGNTGSAAQGDFEYGFRNGFDHFAHQSYKGQDVSAHLDITFDEAVSGCDKIISYQDEKGDKQSLKVHIPAGIDTGKRIRLTGRGAAGMNGGPAGDLYLEVTVGEKAGYERKGQDVYTSIHIPYTTAVFGGEVIVPTLYGNQGRNPVRNKDPSKGQGDCIHEPAFGSRRPVCDSSDSGSPFFKSGGGAEAEGISESSITRHCRHQ